MGAFRDFARALGLHEPARATVTADLRADGRRWTVTLPASGAPAVVSVTRDGDPASIEEACCAFGATVDGLALLAWSAYQQEQKEGER